MLAFAEHVVEFETLRGKPLDEVKSIFFPSFAFLAQQPSDSVASDLPDMSKLMVASLLDHYRVRLNRPNWITYFVRETGCPPSARNKLSEYCILGGILNLLLKHFERFQVFPTRLNQLRTLHTKVNPSRLLHVWDRVAVRKRAQPTILCSIHLSLVLKEIPPAWKKVSSRLPIGSI